MLPGPPPASASAAGAAETARAHTANNTAPNRLNLVIAPPFEERTFPGLRRPQTVGRLTLLSFQGCVSEDKPSGATNSLQILRPAALGPERTGLAESRPLQPSDFDCELLSGEMADPRARKARGSTL